MAGRFLGPVSWNLSGPRERVVAMENYARDRMGWLFDELQHNGAKQPCGVRTHLWPFTDGSFIRAYVSQDLRGHRLAWCKIDVPSVGKATVEPVLTTLTMVMEHGLLTVNLADLLSDPETTPGYVFVPPNVAEYYAGNGWEIPNTDPIKYTHFMGTLTTTLPFPPALIGTSEWLLDGTDEPPTLSTERSHPSLHGAGANSLDYLISSGSQIIHPKKYTGLGRAWVQAITGAGLKILDVFERMPPAFDLLPGILGFMQEPSSGQYWICNISANGMIAHPMVSGSTTAPIVQWIADEASLSGLQKELASAYVLADLYPDYTRESIILISAQEMEKVYNGIGETTDRVVTIYMEDSVPVGASQYAMGGDAWTWITSNPSPHSGTASHVSTAVSGLHYHYCFNNTGSKVYVDADDYLYVWVYIYSASVPREILIEWKGESNAWEHRAYWGENLINLGTNSTTSRRYVGPIPNERDQWVLLEVPAAIVGMGGTNLIGTTFALYDGRIVWDQSGVISPPVSYGSATAVSLQNGWVWNADGSRAAIATHRAVFSDSNTYAASESSLSEIEITWSGPDENGKYTPAATLTSSPWARFRPYWSHHRFWYGSGSLFHLLAHGNGVFPLSWSNKDCADVAPILVWYSANDELQQLNYFKCTPIAGTSFSSGTLAELTNSCPNSKSYIRTTYAAGAVNGGYGIGSNTPAPSGNSAVTKDVRSCAISEGSYIESRGWRYAHTMWFGWSGSFLCSGPEESEIPLTDSDWITIIHIKYGTATGSITSETRTSSLGVSLYAYNQDAPGVLWGGELKRETGGTFNRSDIAGSEMHTGAKVSIISKSNWENLGRLVYIQKDVAHLGWTSTLGLPGDPAYGNPAAYHGNQQVFCNAKSASIVASSGNNDPTETFSLSLLINGNLLANDTVADHWEALLTGSEKTIEVELSANFSHKDIGYYTVYPNAEYQQNANVSSEAIPQQNQPFHARAWVGSC